MMNVGSELDLLIAEKIMGWKVLSHWEPGIIKHLIDHNQCEVRPPIIKSYSTDITAAFEVIHRLVGTLPDVDFELIRFGDGRWGATFFQIYLLPSEGETPEEAICLAALKAIGENSM